MNAEKIQIGIDAYFPKEKKIEEKHVMSAEKNTNKIVIWCLFPERSKLDEKTHHEYRKKYK